MTEVLIAAFYKFTDLPDFESLQSKLQNEAAESGIKGSVLLAKEGINGTVGGNEEGLRNFLTFLRQDPRLADLAHKEAKSAKMPFKRMKVRLKKEIVPLGIPGVNPEKSVGTYVDPENWNDLINRDDVVLVDTRNNYEIAFGTFKNSVNPNTRHFRQFAGWVENSKDLLSEKKIAMFCTGGIRCEKATSLLKDLGYEDVYHLNGGILNYLEKIPQEQSLWDGECFVFDDRISVDHNLDACWGAHVPPESQSAVYPALKMSPEEKQRRSAGSAKNSQNKNNDKRNLACSE